MRIYISGPMTGHPKLNRDAFRAAAVKLRKNGHFVVNPHDLTRFFGTADKIAESFKALYFIEKQGPGFHPHITIVNAACLARAVMDADLAAVRSCDAIYLLKGWENSRGAKKELAEAVKYDLMVLLEKEKP